MTFEDCLPGRIGNCYRYFGEKDIHIAIVKLGYRYEGECYIIKFVAVTGTVGQRVEAEFICCDGTHDTTVSTTNEDAIGRILVFVPG